MAIRVVHWGTGQTGRLALQGVIGHPDLELVGVVVQRPENVGRGKVITALEHVNFLSEEMPAHWPRAALGKDTVYRIEIAGRPSHRCEIALDYMDGEDHGLIGTAMRAINGIPATVAAAPGLLGANDVPAVCGRHVRAR